MLRAIILIALVGHAAAVNCVSDDTDGDAKVAALCDAIGGNAVTECYTLVPATGTTTRGCGGAAQCAESGCVICDTDDCNKKENILKCWVGTVTDGVLDGATKVCAPKDANCYSRSLTSDTTGATMDKGCGACAAAATKAGYTCAGDADCTVANDYGCNIPKISCFTSTGLLTRYTTTECVDADMLTCFTKTMDDKTVEFGCGKCTTGSGYTCGDDCGTIVAAGCNEPPHFQCLQKDDWKVTDTDTKASDCVTGDGASADSSTYTETSCSKIVKDDGTMKKACGACSASAVKGETCYQCDETGCNSASGLFSVLALSMAVIYQLA